MMASARGDTALICLALASIIACDEPPPPDATTTASAASAAPRRRPSILGTAAGNSRNPRLWTRLRVDVRFPGASTYVKRSQGAGPRCERLFDLAVDDVYWGPAGASSRVAVDATFLDRAPAADERCDGLPEGLAPYVHPMDRELFFFQTQVTAAFPGEAADDPGPRVLPLHPALAGRARDTQTGAFGASNAWELSAPPHNLYAPMHLRLAFGPAGTEAVDMLAVALDGTQVTVMKRSPAATHAGREGPGGPDLRAEWLSRHVDDDLYFLRKVARGYLSPTELPSAKHEMAQVLCPLLAEALAGPDPWPPDDAVFQRMCP